MCNPGTFALAVTGSILGPPMAIWPHRMAKLDEFLDAIGRRPAGPVEPADWKVSLTRFGGVALSVLGFLAIVSIALC